MITYQEFLRFRVMMKSKKRIGLSRLFKSDNRLQNKINMEVN